MTNSTTTILQTDFVAQAYFDTNYGEPKGRVECMLLCIHFFWVIEYWMV